MKKIFVKYKTKIAFFCLSSFIIILLVRVDLVSKDMVFDFIEKEFLMRDEYKNNEKLPENINFTIIINSFFNISKVKNTGIAFGMFHNIAGIDIVLLIINSSLTICLFIFLQITKIRHLKYSLVFIISGAIGNIYDRIKLSYVRDFLDFHYKDFHWPVFNIADSFITVGIIIMIVYEIKYTFSKKKA